MTGVRFLGSIDCLWERRLDDQEPPEKLAASLLEIIGGTNNHSLGLFEGALVRVQWVVLTGGRLR